MLKPSQIKLGSSLEKVKIHCEFCDKEALISSLDSAKRLQAKASLTFLHTLNSKLQQSEIFKDAEFSLLSSDSLLSIIKNHSSRVKENGLVIVLDSIYLKDTIIVQKQKYIDYEVDNYAIIHKFGCKIYELRTMQLINDYILQDTAFWPSQMVADSYPIMEVPVIDDAIWDTGIKAGEKYAHYLAPYWVEQSRLFYTGYNKSFNAAFKLIQEDKLDSAIVILKNKAGKIRGSAHKAKALHNIAIVYELKDDINNALAISDSSYKISEKKFAKEYSQILRLRKLDKNALDWQMAE